MNTTYTRRINGEINGIKLNSKYDEKEYKEREINSHKQAVEVMLEELKQNVDKEILQGFPWVFDNEILSVKNHDEKNLLPDGSEVDVFSKSGNYLGTGIYNKKSKRFRYGLLFILQRILQYI